MQINQIKTHEESHARIWREKLKQAQLMLRENFFHHKNTTTVLYPSTKS